MEITEIISRDPEIVSGELVFAGTRVPVKNLVDYLAAGHTLDYFLEGFPGASREQAEAYLRMSVEVTGENLSRFDLVVVIMRSKSNRYEDLSPLMDEVNSVLDSISPSTLLTVPAGSPS